MEGTDVMNPAGTTPRLLDAALTDLSHRVAGQIIRPTDTEYNQARRVWNGAHDRYPAAIIQCRGVADVVDTVQLARDARVPLAVRGGAHSIPGFSTCDDGIVLDLSLMRTVQVDPVRRQLEVQAGCRWSDIDTRTQEFQLAVTGGLVSSTGVAGFTLGGGIGWLTRRCGLTVDNLYGADLVTADGSVVRAEDDPELLWALKGGGGNFGVVTSFRMALHDVGPTVFAGAVVYPAHQAAHVLKGYSAACHSASEQLTTLLKLTTAPAPGGDPNSAWVPVVVIAGCWAGDADAASSALEPFRTLGTVLTDGFSHRRYADWQTALDAQFPAGLHCYFKSAFIEDVDGVTIASLVAAHRRLPNRLTEIVIHQLGGKVGRIAGSATAFAIRDQPFLANVIARSDGAETFGAVKTYARTVIDELSSDSTGYVNFAGDNDVKNVQASYPPATLDRLTAVKSRYDSGNVFRLNQNILPGIAR